MANFGFVIGVDMGKSSFNYCVQSDSGMRLKEGVVENTATAIGQFTHEMKALLTPQGWSQCMLCLEHTGIYNNPLIQHWCGAGGRLSVVAGQKISRLLAGDQGWDEKNDWMDARRIAEYAFRFGDKLVPYQPKTDTLARLTALHRQRRRLLDAKHLLETPVNEAQDFVQGDQIGLVAECQQRTMEAINADLKAIEQRMDQIMREDEELKLLYQLITSVEGVGPVIAREVIITTEAFTKFAPNQAKAFAKYAGVTPKEWSSGTSVRKRITSKRGHQLLKSILTMGARSLSATNGELGQYYRRKMAEGKHHLSVMNAMRNKIILRIFAVVRNQVTYQKNLNLCLDNP